jgi:hypothetical protein
MDSITDNMSNSNAILSRKEFPDLQEYKITQLIGFQKVSWASAMLMQYQI